MARPGAAGRLLGSWSFRSTPPLGHRAAAGGTDVIRVVLSLARDHVLELRGLNELPPQVLLMCHYPRRFRHGPTPRQMPYPDLVITRSEYHPLIAPRYRENVARACDRDGDRVENVPASSTAQFTQRPGESALVLAGVNAVSWGRPVWMSQQGGCDECARAPERPVLQAIPGL